MIKLLSGLIIKSPPDAENEQSRRRYGVLCGAVGIFFNLCLFCLKLAAGIISGSIAITADAFNNLSDAGSSVITIFGFRIAAIKPDLEHPFGHGRMEYLAGLLVSAMIVIVGVQLGISSVRGIISPSEPEFSWLLVGILLASILVKTYMAFYNRRYSKLVNSPALAATAIDSLSDCITTSAVLISLFIFKLWSVNVDAYCGLLVAIFILYSGLKSAKETVDPLLGSPADKEFCKKVKGIVLSHEGIAGVHDLIVHDYGPGRRMISLHAEVPASGNILVMHDLVDNIEGDLREELGCVAVIHMDPIETDNEKLSEIRRQLSEAVKKIGAECSIHDLRMVSGPTHTNLIFDIIVPYEFAISDDEVKLRVNEIVHDMDESYNVVLTIDKGFVE